MVCHCRHPRLLDQVKLRNQRERTEVIIGLWLCRIHLRNTGHLSRIRNQQEEHPIIYSNSRALINQKYPFIYYWKWTTLQQYDSRLHILEVQWVCLNTCQHRWNLIEKWFIPLQLLAAILTSNSGRSNSKFKSCITNLVRSSPPLLFFYVCANVGKL